jgi:hypothetical protein
MFKGKVNNDGDASVQVGTTSNGTAIWGFHKCKAAQAPSPSATTLSFACSHPGDPNCTENVGIPSQTTGCGQAGASCYVGAAPYGWETLHADYWQTWQEATHALDSQAGGTDVSSDSGTFGDLVEDCVTGSSGTCSFITDTTPSQVYGSSGSNP